MTNLISKYTVVASLLAVFISFSTTSQAQISLGGYAGPMLTVTEVDGETAFLAGGTAALMVGRYFYIGGYGNIMTSRIARSIQSEQFDIGYTQVGLLAGAVINPQNKLQVTGTVLLGMGRLAAKDNALKDRLLQVGPNVGLQYAVLDFMRIEVAGGYRISTKANESLFDNPNLRAPFGTMTVKLGDFN